MAQTTTISLTHPPPLSFAVEQGSIVAIVPRSCQGDPPHKTRSRLLVVSTVGKCLLCRK